MALCHDERDYAMGFTRDDPHTRHRPSPERLAGREEREKYLASLTPHQKQAHKRVKFCIRAIGQYPAALRRMVNVEPRELHKFFPAFAKEMGWRGPLYRDKNGKCPAISISFPEPKEKLSFWFINPYYKYVDADENKKKEVETKKARRAALNFCKSWLPGWKWHEIVLPKK